MQNMAVLYNFLNLQTFHSLKVLQVIWNQKMWTEVQNIVFTIYQLLHEQKCMFA